MAAPACYDDGSSTESEFYFDPDDEAASEALGGAAARAEDKLPAVASVAAFPSPSVTDGAKRQARSEGVSGADGRAGSSKTATVTDSDSSTEGAEVAKARRDKGRVEDAASAAKEASGGAAVGRPGSRAAPRIVSLARIPVDRAAGTASATSSTIRKLSGSLRQSLSDISAAEEPLLGKIKQGLSNPRPSTKRSQPSSAESSPRFKGLESKRPQVEYDDARSGSSRDGQSRQAEPNKSLPSRHRKGPKDQLKDEAPRASRGEGRSERTRGSRSIEWREDEIPPRVASESSSSRRSSSENGSRRSDQDRASSLASKERSLERTQSDEPRWSASRYHDYKKSGSRSSSRDVNSTQSLHRSQSRHSDARRSDTKSTASEHSSSRNPRRSSSHHPESRKQVDMSDDPRASSAGHGSTHEYQRGDDSHRSSAKRSESDPTRSKHDNVRDPRRRASIHLERKWGEESDNSRPSSSGSRDPRQSSSLDAEARSREEKRSDARPGGFECISSRDPRRSRSLHPEVRNQMEKGSSASSFDDNFPRDHRRSASRHPEQRSRSPRQRQPTEQQQFGTRRSSSRHREAGSWQNPGRVADEYENKCGRPEFQRSVSQHPESRHDISRRPPPRGSQLAAFSDDRDGRAPLRNGIPPVSPSPRSYFNRPRFDFHQPNQHEPFHNEPAYRSERFFEPRDDREGFLPRLDNRRGYPIDRVDSATAFDRQERSQYSPREFVRQDGSLSGYFHDERRQRAGYERQDARLTPPAQDPKHLPPGYYLMQALAESPRPQQAEQSATWRDPRRDPRAPRDPRLQPGAAASSVQTAQHSQPPPIQFHHEGDARDRFNSRPVDVGRSRSVAPRSRSVAPQRGADPRQFSEQAPEKRARTFDGSYAAVARLTSPSRHRGLDDARVSEAGDLHQRNANGKRARTQVSPPPSHTPCRTDVLLAEGRIDEAYVKAVARFKLTSRFAEQELLNPNTFHKHSYLLAVQENMAKLKKRLQNRHPDDFHDVFEDAVVTQERIKRFGASKEFVQRMLRYLREAEELKRHYAAVAAGENVRSNDLDWRQQRVEKQRKQLIGENLSMFDRMLQQWDPKRRACVFTRSFNDEWSDF